MPRRSERFPPDARLALAIGSAAASASSRAAISRSRSPAADRDPFRAAAAHEGVAWSLQHRRLQDQQERFMTANGEIAKVDVAIHASKGAVWQALVAPEAIKEYMFGTEVETDWSQGSEIKWKGEFKGKKYEDKGVVLAIEPQRSLKYSHYSPMSGKPDVPESYNTVTVELSGRGDETEVTISQDNNANEKARLESEKNWNTVLQGLKKYAERH
jgi:uncharacterized protein YndB with AHSA1/START domain